MSHTAGTVVSVLLAVFCTTLSHVVSAATPDLALTVTTDRVLYEPGTTAAFSVTAANKVEAEFSGRLRINVWWEMGESKPLLDAPLTLKPTETKDFVVRWAGLPAVMGAEARAEL